jgi:hypothetical protein
LKELEKKHVHADVSDRLQKMPKKDFQLSIFEAADPRWDELKATLAAIDIPTTNPVEALLKLQELKREFLD